MPSVCFTGRGYNRAGAFIERGVWERQAQQAAFTVVQEVTPSTNYLVASRSDTSKANAARRFGDMGYDVRVVTYNEWLDVVQRQTGIRPPTYSIGYFRREFTAMRGDYCMGRFPIAEHAEACIRVEAANRGINPQIEWTIEAERARRQMENNRLARGMNQLAGYADRPRTQTPVYQSPRTSLGPIPDGVTWDEEDQCFRGAMNYVLPDETYQRWFERRAEFPRFTDRAQSQRHTRVEPPAPAPTHVVSPITQPRRAINWDD